MIYPMAEQTRTAISAEKCPLSRRGRQDRVMLEAGEVEPGMKIAVGEHAVAMVVVRVDSGMARRLEGGYFCGRGRGCHRRGPPVG